MIFKKATFKNYRLLHDVEIEFSTLSTKPLTVIRGASGFGKSTMFEALRWAFYGSDSLKGDYKIADANLHSQMDRVQASVEVIFDVDDFRTDAHGDTKPTQTHYRLKRIVAEDHTEGLTARRGPDTVSLFERKKGGWEKINQGDEILLRNQLPENVKDVFFIDGDTALKFVNEGGPEERRNKVSRAATEMLDIELINTSIKRVRTSLTETSKQAASADKDTEEYAAAVKRKAEAEKRLGDEKEKLAGHEKTAKERRAEYEKLDKALIEELRKGNKDDAAKQLTTARRAKEKAELDQDNALHALSAAFQSDDLAVALTSAPLKKATKQLEEMKKVGAIPSNLVPILKDLLEAQKCFCHTKLSKDSKARGHIEAALNVQKETDEDDNYLNDLRHASLRLLDGQPARAWNDEIKDSLGNYQSAGETYDGWAAEEKQCETKLAELKDSKVDELKQVRDLAKKNEEKATGEATEQRTTVKSLERQLAEDTQTVAALKKTLDKENKYRAEVDVSDDLISMLESARESILTEQLDDLSKAMGEEFLSMVGMTDIKEASITKAELSRNFDIIIHSSDGPLNPANELSGAQQRALTFAFIQALIGTSGIIAPNVIDTPLGMAEGPVKRELLKRTIKQSSQLIMFLTRSEIRDCEDIIGQYAGKQVTITNTGSGAVVNRPGGSPDVLVCGCGIDKECKICKIKKDFQSG